MANNPFDQFDDAPKAVGGNAFDQFDAPAPNETAPKPKAPSLKRTGAELAKDLGVGVVQGAGYLLGGTAELANVATGGLLDKGVRHANAAITTATTGVKYDPDKANGITEAYNIVNAEADAAKSPILRRKQQELADTKGFLPSAKKVLTDPVLAGQFLAEQAPNLALMGAGAAPTLARGVAAAEARGLTGEAAAKAGQASLQRQIVGVNAIQEAGPAAQQVANETDALPEEVWQGNADYVRRVQAGEDPQAVKDSLAVWAGAKAALVGGAAGAVGGLITAPLEAKLFTRQALGEGGKGLVRTVAGTAGKEALEETVQEGGNQFATNVGMQGIDAERSLMEGVPEAAGTGAALGGLLGGGMAGVGHLTQRPSLRREPVPDTQPSADPAPDVSPVVPNPGAVPGSLSDVVNTVAAPAAVAAQDAAPDVPLDGPQDDGIPFDVTAPVHTETQVDEWATDLAAQIKAGRPVPTDAGELAEAWGIPAESAQAAIDRITQAVPPGADLSQPWSREQIKGYLATQLDLSSPGRLPKSGILSAVYGITPREASELRQEVIAEGKANALSRGSAPAGNDPAVDAVGPGGPARADVPVAGDRGGAPGSLTEAADTTAAHAPTPAGVPAPGLTDPRDVLRELGRLSNEVAGGQHPNAVDLGTADGTFGGLGNLNMDEQGNVVLQRVAGDEAHLGKGWAATTGLEELLETSLHHGGGNAIPTSGLADWTQSFQGGHANGIVGTFRIPPADLLAMVKNGDAILGNLGEGEIVLNPAAAQRYLTEINGQPATAGTLAPAGTQANPRTTSTAAAPADAAPAPGALPAPSVPATAPAAPQGSEVQAAPTLEASADTTAAGSAQDGQGAVTAAAAEAAPSPLNDRPEPTEAQKEAGNYKKGHAKIGGLDISIENPAGTSRRPEWPPLAHHYGYIKRTVGKDKDHVDVFMGERAEDTALPVFVVDQNNADGSFDEHKVILGATSADEARAMYRANYAADWNGDGAVTQMSHDEFEAWVRDPQKTMQPASPVSGEIAEEGGMPAPVEPATAQYGAAIEDEIRPRGKKIAFKKADSVAAELAQRGLNPADYSIEERDGGYIGVRKGAAKETAPAPVDAETTHRDKIQAAKEKVLGLRKKVSELQGGLADSALSAATRDKLFTARGQLQNAERQLQILRSQAFDDESTSTPTAGNKDDAAQAERQPTNEAPKGPRVIVQTIGKDGLTDAERAAGKPSLADPEPDAGTVQGPLDTPAKADPFANNTLFTADKVEAARARLKAKLGTFNSGIDPEVLVDGMTIAGAYIESGVRRFGDYAKAMIADLGEGVKPYLLSFYEAARHYPGLSREGLDSTDEAARQHAALLTPADLKSEAIGNPTPAPKKRAKPSRGGKRLTDDWGVDHIDGYTELPGKPGTQTDYGIKGGVKDAFLNEARTYLNDVADVLHDAGFTTPLARNGKPGKPVSLNEGGPAGSGEAILHLEGPSGLGIEVWVGTGALRGVVPSSQSGATIMYRTKDKAGRYGVNQWARTDLTAEQLAAELVAHHGRSVPADQRTAASQDSAQNAPQETLDVQRANDRQSDRAGSVQGDQRQQPAEARDDDAAANLDAEQRPEAARPGAGGRAGGRAQEGVSTGPRGGVRNPDEQPAPDADRVPDGSRTPPQAVVPRTDLTITDELDFRGVGPVAKFKNNLAAIALLKRLEAEGRHATAEEQSVLARYVGWGGLPQAFNNNGKVAKGWEARVAELEAALTPEELAAAARSTQDAHYTAAGVVRAMWSAVARLGFARGRVLEPSMGVGNFFGLMPTEARAGSKLTGVELDSITGRIAKQLYQSANVQVRGFNDLRITPDSFDLAIGNPPFGAQSIHDPQHPDLSKFSIHNFFFAKSIAALRPGGVLAMVVSNSFLDANTSSARQWIAERARLLGAIRLPQTAFQANAGTAVTTDIVFLQRLAPNEQGNAEEWVKVGSSSDQGNAFPLNRYFLKHPDMMLGKMAWSSHTTFNRAGAVLQANEGENLDEALAAAVAKLPADVYQAPGKGFVEVVQQAQSAEVPSGARVYGYFVQDGHIRQRQPDFDGQSQSVVVDLKPAEAKRVMAMAKIRDLARDLLDTERTDATDSLIAGKRERLNAAYDAFVKESGRLSRDVNKRAFRDDPDIALLLSLEKDYDKGVSATVAKKLGVPQRKESATKADLFSKRLNYPERPVTEVADAKSAMLASLNERGRLDLDFMAGIYPGKSAEEVEAELGDLVFRTTEGELQPADLYLSGNVKAKLAAAKAVLRENPGLARNIAALEAVQPADVDATDIFVQIGTPWIPTSDYDAFARETFEGRVEGSFVAPLGRWSVVVRSSNRTLNNERWGTERMTGSEILAHLMEGRPVAVYDKTDDDKRVLNPKETAAAKGKAEEMQTTFLDWLWKDAARRERLARFYNDTFNTDVRWKPDGSHLTLPGMNRAVLHGGNLRPHQLNYVHRQVQQGVSLADHVVGAGKTYAAIASVMEKRRLGLARKPMIGVPNHLVEQWAADFVRLYPGASVLAATRKDFQKKNRHRLFARIATGDWDAVIVAHSSFGFIPLPPAVERRILDEEAAEIQQAMAVGDKKDRSFKELQKRKERIEEKIKALSARKRDDLLDFAQMGVDDLTIDEAHEFKNLYFVTRQQGVAGLGSPEGSKKAFDLFVKTRYLADDLGGKNLQFLTGTPISNSLAEAYHMQRYLQLDELKARGVAMFDTWAATFGQIVSDWEMDAAGRFKEKARFRKFANLPELVTMWRGVADTVTLADLKRDAAEQGKRFPVPKIAGGKRQNITVARSPLQADFIGVGQPILDAEGKPVIDEETGAPRMQYPEGSIIWRMENMPKDPSLDNHLKATGDARKASLDFRLVDPNAPDFPGSKINRMVADVARIYRENAPRRGTQLIFCDLSVPASARGKATAAAQDRVPTWFVREGDGIAHVAGVKLSLSAMADRAFFSVNDRGYTVYEAGSGTRIAWGKTKQEAVDEANAKLTASPGTYLEAFTEEAIPGAQIDAYVQQWEDARAAAAEANEATADTEDAPAEEQETITLDDLLADQSSFSVYDDVKAKLIAAGIPAAEIAFIHDANTDAQKADLFAKMNRGDVRVLMGSTQKMGAGMNVQKKLVALHHADAPWRPSDMEQREGRIIRQGNEFYEADPDGFEVILNAYGTEETYDSRQYEIIETKARGIEQFKAGALDVREIDDIASESASSAEMKAAASGNPLILESQKLRKDVRDLEAQARSHQSARHAMETVIRSVDNKTAYGYKQQREAAARLAKYGDAPWSLTLGGKTITDPKELKVEPIAAAFKDAIETRKTVVAGTFRGLDVVVDSYLSSTVGEGKNKRSIYAVRVSLFAGEHRVGSTEYGSEQTINAAGFVTRLNNLHDNLADEVKYADAQVAKVEREAQTAREEVERPFPRAAELETKRARMAKVVAALRAGQRELADEPRAPLFSRPDPALQDEDDFDLLENNGSGDSSASIEAINRRLENIALGQVRVLIERDGSVRALLGVDAVDTHARAGQIIVQRGVGNEEWTVLSQGNDVSRDLARGRLNAAKAKIDDLLADDEPLFSKPTGRTRGMEAEQLVRLVKATTEGWGDNAPKVRAVATAGELPAYVRESEGWETAEGLYDEQTGTVYLVAQNLGDARRARQVLMHEAVGHYGMEAITGPQLWAEIGETVRAMRASGKHAALFDEIGRRYVGANESIFVREAVAVMAEKGVHNSVLDRVIAAMRRFLRSLGITMKFSEAELRQMVVAAARYVRAGSRPRVAPSRKTALASQPAPVFYSALQASIARAQGAPQKGNAQAWTGWLDGAQRRGEFRQAERDWMGLDAWLAGRGTTTRADLAAFVAANHVQVKDVVLSDAAGQPEISDNLSLWLDENYDEGRETAEEWRDVAARLEREAAEEEADGDDRRARSSRRMAFEAERIARRLEDGDTFDQRTQYASYQLPGGADYRELLLTLPREPDFSVDDFIDAMVAKYGHAAIYDNPDEIVATIKPDFPAMLSAEDQARFAEVQRARKPDRAEFISGHWAPNNVLAHVRFNTRTDADGKRVLFLEEIQSDWHQAGRKRGYRQNRPTEATKPWEVFNTREHRTVAYFDTEAEALADVQARGDGFDYASTGADDATADTGVPDAPFKGTEDWAMLAFKRMVRWAADNGFERIAWTTGDQQAARYDLSTQIDKLYVGDAGGGAYRVEAFRGGASVIEKTVANANELSDTIGKELAERAVKDVAESGQGTYAGLDLKIGGKGMVGFYDKILPGAVNKWAKKLGGKVGTTTIATERTGGTRIDDGAGGLIDVDGALQVSTQHSLDLTDAMRDAARAGQPLFSRPDPNATLGAMGAAAKGPALAAAKEAFANLNPRNLRENTRPTWLGALTLRHLAELAKDLKLPFVASYADRVQQMATDRNVMQDEAAQVSEPWEKFQRKNRAGADAMANLMHDSTIAGVDPSVDYVPLMTGDTARGPSQPVTREEIDRRVKLVDADLADTTAQKAKDRLHAERQELIDLLIREHTRHKAMPALVQRWLALPEEGRRLYTAAREAYGKQSDRLEAAIIARILGSGANGRARDAAVQQIRHQFESARIEGPYFPLARFGEFWIQAEGAEGMPFFSLYETVQEWRQAQTDLAKAGFVVKGAGRKIAEARSVAGASTGFMADLEAMLEDAGVPDSTRDDVWQLFLRTLPELSMRKHSIHRKKTAGYSKDALRAFAGNMFHGSFQIARVRHTHELEAELLGLKRAVAQLGSEDPERAAKAAALATELGLRHEWVMNPKDSKAVSSLTSLGFTWYLGATPAAALVNLTQTAIVTFPVLASRFGVTRAANALTNGMSRALRNVDGKSNRGLSGEEQSAMVAWHASGALTHTSAHNLAGLSETDTQAFNPLHRKVMGVVSFLFHKAEVVNREATALAAFRLARSAGDSFAQAVKYAEEVINESHFDYTNANRARFMQSNAAKVLLLFRQYSLNMTWFLWRNFYLATRGADPQVKKAARIKLGGVLGMTGIFAGAMGLPLMSVLFGIANAAQAAFGDDDEPFDAEVAFRNFLADHLGPGFARVLTEGPVNALTGAEIGHRVSLNDLWLRDPDRELEGQAKADYLLEQAAGPVAGGMLVNTLRGWNMVEEGQTWRGVETMLPKALKDGMKAIRYSTQGVNTLRGDPIIEDLGVGGTLLQLAGFSPASLAERYDANNAAKNFENHLQERRQALLDGFALAWRNEDSDALARTRDAILEWNGKHPELGITMATIRRSLESRMAYSARAEGGVVLDRRIAEQAKQQARFAE